MTSYTTFFGVRTRFFGVFYAKNVANADTGKNRYKYFRCNTKMVIVSAVISANLSPLPQHYHAHRYRDPGFTAAFLPSHGKYCGNRSITAIPVTVSLSSRLARHHAINEVFLFWLWYFYKTLFREVYPWQSIHFWVWFTFCKVKCDTSVTVPLTHFIIITVKPAYITFKGPAKFVTISGVDNKRSCDYVWSLQSLYGIQKSLYFVYSNILITMNPTNMSNDHIIIFYLSIK